MVGREGFGLFQLLEQLGSSALRRAVLEVENCSGVSTYLDCDHGRSHGYLD